MIATDVYQKSKRGSNQELLVLKSDYELFRAL